MDPTLSRQAEQLFGAALDVEPGRRAQFLDEACAGEASLRSEVQAMLDAFARSSDYFEKLPQRLGVAALLGDATATARAAAAGEAGEKYGPYTLTECIGTGGMGTVWRARRHDGRFEGEVAIKLLTQFAHRPALERFELEGRYLAKLTHPHIARLLDAGVSAGSQPFLVIEYVRGLAIDQWCDEHRLNIARRIELFLQVLDAVAHAHSHLIVHRDIKPSNVQVTPDGTVKLLDFGVAKLLAGDGMAAPDLTRQLGTALTPQFAAPEQLEGAVVTTATDVYSLGLLLWLLAVGSTPRTTHEIGSLAELRALANRDPARLLDTVTSDTSFDRLAALAARRDASPSDLLKTLRGDLDSIVRKAVAVEPRERYATVADFARDLRRLLRHEPVAAQVNTVAYRVRKFLRRHRGSVATSALALFAILAAGVLAVWQGIEARQQRDAAIYQQRRAQATNEFMNLLLSEIGPTGRALTLGELLDRGVGMLERQYGAEQRFLGPILYELATGYFSLGRNDRIVELLGRAEQAAREHGDSDLLAATLCTLGRTQLRADPALSRERIVSGRAALADTAAPSVEARVSCARAEAQLLEMDGNRAAAIAKLDATLTRVEADPAALLRQNLFLMNELSRLHFNERDLGRALALVDRILEAMERNGLGNTAGFVVNAANRSALLATMGEVSNAAKAQAALRERLRDAHEDSRPVGFGVTYAASLLRLARYEEALAILETEAHAARMAGNSFVAAEADMHIGRIRVQQRRFAEAQRCFDAAEQEFSKAAGSNQRLLDMLVMYRAQALLGLGDVAGARAATEAALRKLGYPQRRDAPPLLNVLRIAAQIAAEGGDAESVQRFASEFHAIAIRNARAPEHSADVGEALLLRAKARRTLGDAQGARADLTAAIPSLVDGLGAEHPQTLEARSRLAEMR